MPVIDLGYDDFTFEDGILNSIDPALLPGKVFGPSGKNDYKVKILGIFSSFFDF